MDEKKELRKRIKALKSGYTLEEKRRKSGLIWEQMERHEWFLQAKTVLLYWAMEDEVNTWDFVCKWAEEKRVLLTCVKGDQLELRLFQGLDSLKPGEGFGIPEPVGEEFTDYAAIDVVVVPGIAFDAEGNRLGRGRGYYDRILRETGGTKKIGVCFDFQFVESVPTESFDVPMDAVLYA